MQTVSLCLAPPRGAPPLKMALAATSASHQGAAGLLAPRTREELRAREAAACNDPGPHPCNWHCNAERGQGLVNRICAQRSASAVESTCVAGTQSNLAGEALGRKATNRVPFRS